MKMLRILLFLHIFVFSFSLIHLSAQKTKVNSFPDNPYYRGLELFHKQKYGAAQEQFNYAIENSDDVYSEIRKDAAFYSALCAAKLYNDDAEYLLFRFVKLYPGSIQANRAFFELGNYAYYKKNYYGALKWYEQVDRFILDDEELAEYYFKKGYCHFKRDEYDLARTAFYEIKDTENKYASPATYYYSHIAYEQKNYETALEGFLKISDDETFAPIVPYYVSQIYYLQKKWDKVIEYAPPMLETITESRQAEMYKIIGDAYFQKEKYKEAIPYLEKYHELKSGASWEDKYQLGFAYYKTGAYDKARDYFKSVSFLKNELAQSALYHLGDCYLRLGDKNQARLSFAAACRFDFDPVIKEDALFNYAVATYELSYSPFNEAVKAFNEFIELYPASDKTDEAYNYLVLAYMGTRNYKAALSSLEKIRRKTPEIERAYQRVAFFRGLELFKNQQYNEAINKFDGSLQYGTHDPLLKALAYYWKGESYYRLNDYEQAIEYYNNFLMADGARSLNEYKICHYNMAYACFKKGEYPAALTWFRKFEDLSANAKSRLLGDAFNRIGDLYFLESRHQDAISYYDKAINLDLIDTDYAIFQKGFTLGLVGNHAEKIIVLSQILDRYKNSAYTTDALYETGRAYFILQQFDRAIPFYNQILSEHQNSSYISKAMLQLGLINYNQDKYDQSIAFYKRVIEEFPGTSEAQGALAGIRNVYVDMNRVDEYISYVESLGEAVDISVAEQDSLTYTAAENIYMSGNIESSKTSFGNYIDKFPAGKFLLQANFYKAECHIHDGEVEQALASLDYVISRPRNDYSEPALASAAGINYDLGKYPEALEDYLMLEQVAEMKSNLSAARVGKMRCYYLLEEYGNTIDAAREVLLDDKIPEELSREAHFRIANSFYLQDRFPLALEEFEKVAVEVKTLMGAEAKYRVAEIHYIRKEYQEAEDVIFDFIDQNTPHQYWMAKAFILLSDIYMGRNDDFQAVQTLQSIIDYYENSEDGIIDTAVRKKDEITRRQTQPGSPKPADTLNIEIQGGQ